VAAARPSVLIGVQQLFSLVAAASAWLGDGLAGDPVRWLAGLILLIEGGATTVDRPPPDACW